MIRTNNLRIAAELPLVSPAELAREIPMSDTAAYTVSDGRRQISDIINGKDKRLLAVVGPCSIHDPEAALEYADRLAGLARKYADKVFIVMRVYFEKPRTALGWRGLIVDPGMDGTYDISRGLRTARKLLVSINEMGLTAGSEMLDPIIPQYISELISWASIGARTTESQTHREMASGLSMPIGFKNATDGDIQMAINAVLSAASPHSFVGIDRQGSTIVMRTTGNPDGHLILRGGRSGANFDRLHVYEAYRRMCSSGLHPAVVIDCSHGNSEKKPERQALVLRDVLAQRLDPDSPLIGFMAESNLEQGNQDISPSGEGLRYGVSVTDPCIGWAETVSLLEEAWTRTELPPGSAGSSSHQQKVLSAGSSEVMIFTDGGCSGNPGPGGWAYVIVAPGTSTDRSVGSSVIAERWGAEESTTNNRMELSAAVAALNASLNDPRLAVKSITVYTDSQYVQKGISTWIISWKKNGWQTSSKEPVKNKDLWQELDKLTTRLSIQWRWVKGHAGNEFNERCDALTQEAIASLRV